MIFNYKNIEKNLQELMTIGFEYSTYSSLSTNIKDFINILPKKINNILYNNFNKNKINNKYLNMLINDISYNKFYSIFLLLTIFKIKIKKSQFIQLMKYSGIIAKNIKNNIIYSTLYSGLTFNHYIYSCYSARNSILSKGLITADIGYLMRKITECLRSFYIKESFCGCSNKLKFNNIITYINKCDKKIKYIYYPFLCLSLNNICSKCLSINNNKKENIIIGYNKGIIASQSICEPRLQSALRVFHIGNLKTNINNTLIKVYINKKFNNYYYNNKIKINNLLKNYKQKLKFNKNKTLIFFINNYKLLYNYKNIINNYLLYHNINIIKYKNIYNIYNNFTIIKNKIIINKKLYLII
uniref:DNA-directed RNA polymerase n=1 Tax=Babesia rodhaini TaxID=5870 RepID=A0A455R0Z2_BABRO|nr:RNA polymerase C2a [Babesia rodhaini]